METKIQSEFLQQTIKDILRQGVSYVALQKIISLNLKLA
jgi:hypothetical protein